MQNKIFKCHTCNTIIIPDKNIMRCENCGSSYILKNKKFYRENCYSKQKSLMLKNG